MLPEHAADEAFRAYRTRDGRRFRMRSLINGFTRERVAIRPDRRPRSTNVIDVPPDPIVLRDVPDRMRFENGPEFAAMAVREWIAALGAGAALSSRAVRGRTDTARASARSREASCRTAFDRSARANGGRACIPLQPCRTADPPREPAPAVRQRAPALVAGVPAASCGGHAVAGSATRSRLAGLRHRRGSNLSRSRCVDDGTDGAWSGQRRNARKARRARRPVAPAR